MNTSNPVKLSDYIIQRLVSEGIETCFGYVGGTIAHLLDSIFLNPSMEMVNTIHEQGAGFAAEGYARCTGKTGVVMATSGPGATNLLTPLGSCYFDSVPCLFITGQVNLYEFKDDAPIRQRGFQETDIVAMTRPITKYSVLIREAHQLRYELEKALFLTQHGRKGPVHLDVPMNIQRTECILDEMPSFYASEEHQALLNHVMPLNTDAFKHAVTQVLNQAKRPLVLVGGGVRGALQTKALREFLERSQLPVVHSLMGVDAVSVEYPHHYGLIGAYGNRHANLALANADCVLTLGSRLDTRQTGAATQSFAREATLLRVDTDANELQHHVLNNTIVPLQAELGEAFKLLLNYTAPEEDLSAWLKTLEGHKEQYPTHLDLNGKPKAGNAIINSLNPLLKDDDIIVADVGQHQMWVAQTLEVKAQQRLLLSGGMGAMGFALPAAIGAAIATGKRVVVIAGDGGIQMNIQELEILKRRNLNIKIVVMNNFNLGMVRQFQEIYFDKRCPSTVTDYSVPDLAAIATAYGIRGTTIKHTQDVELALKELLSDDTPALLDVHMPLATVVEPKLMVDRPIEDMYPFVERDELKQNMSIPLWETSV
jgi:acetolactate synthase I/II/III large subunit